MLCAGRVVAGLGIGIASSVVPIYQSEIAPKEIRGRVVSLQQWAITWGVLIQYFIQYGAAQVGAGPDDPNQPEAAFRIPWAVQTIPAIVLLVGLFFLPCSPRWLASKDRWDEAVEVLGLLHGDGDVNHPKVLAEYKEIEEGLRFEREQALYGLQALIQPRILKRVILGMGIQMWSQLSGVNIVMYYIMYIMEEAQIGSPLMVVSIQYVINVVLTVPAIMYLDKIGRRPTLIFGSCFMMLLLFTSGILQAVYGQPSAFHGGSSGATPWTIPASQPAAATAVVACAYLLVATAAATWGPASWTYTAEIFPSRVRAAAVGACAASGWLWNAALALTAPPPPQLLGGWGRGRGGGWDWGWGWKTYVLFGAFNAAAGVHVALCAHETKGVALEEMDDVFDSGRPAWRPRASAGVVGVAGIGGGGGGGGSGSSSSLEPLQPLQPPRRDVERSHVHVVVKHPLSIIMEETLEEDKRERVE
ncbi:high affinity glucose transporter [Hypoxylon texense]